MTVARRMTKEERAQGWYVLGCGCHAYVWRASLLHQIPVEAIECCNGLPGVVRVDALEKLRAEPAAKAGGEG